jgi:deoxyribodipyrimidine photo-lyase
MKQFKKSLFIFRRDLRFYDNTALYEALKQSQEVFLCFIYDPRQITRANKYRSQRAIQFMNESLAELEHDAKKKKTRLNICYGKATNVLAQLITDNAIDAVFVNRDYTPFAKKRDQELQNICTKKQIAFNSYDDILLHTPETYLKDDGTPYHVFTPFFRKAIQKLAPNIKKYSFENLAQTSLVLAKKLYPKNSIILQKQKNTVPQGGRKQALKIIQRLKDFRSYDKTRDIPSIPTTHLSAHIKFGTCSIREVYWALYKTFGRAHPLIRQLYWHDFYVIIAKHYPHIFGAPFALKYNTINWNKSTSWFDRWKKGKTGFPIVDAGMRQLNATGFMHNRVRMITASFLVKDLGIDWRWGEKYFAQHLTDYDPAINNGNWQWIASTGSAHQPYFRVFNPWQQQKRFDPQCVYIKKWVPELEPLTAKEIHKWTSTDKIKPVKYPKPLVDHRIQADLFIKILKKAKKRQSLL